MEITYEGKIKIKEALGADFLTNLLFFLTEEKRFSVKKMKKDEIKLINNDTLEVEIEIEVSTDKIKIEVESTELDLVTKNIDELSNYLSKS